MSEIDKNEHLISFEFEFYLTFYFFDAKIKSSENKFDKLLAIFLGLMGLVASQISKDLFDSSIKFLLSNNPTKKNPDDYLFDFVGQIELAYTKNEYRMVSSFGDSVTNIEVPTVQTKTKENEKVLSEIDIYMTQNKDDYETSLIPEKHPFNFILLPIAMARIYCYITNSLNQEEGDQFRYSVDFYYSKFLAGKENSQEFSVSKENLKRLEQDFDVNLDELDDKTRESLLGMYDPSKSALTAKICDYAGGFFLLIALIAAIRFHWTTFIISLSIGLIVLFAGLLIQRNIAKKHLDNYQNK